MADSADGVYTFQDAVDVLVDYLGGNAAAAAGRDIRRAVQESYDDLCGMRQWSHFQRVHYFETYAAEEGTLSYSASTNLFTLDTGTLPAWAEGATISAGGVRYRIARRDSGTTCTPVASMTPVADIDALTPFTIFMDVFTLPTTFAQMSDPMGENGTFMFGQYVPPFEWSNIARYGESLGTPAFWTVMADPVFTGRQAVHLWPAPDENVTLAIHGKFHPRSLKLTGHLPAERQGTISVSGSTVTGSGTAFRSDMVGSILRISIDATSAPEGLGGLNPYQYQRPITAYSSATGLTIGGDSVGTITTKKYTISDPLDVSRSMYNAVLRGAELRVSNKKGTPAIKAAEADFARALQRAQEDDSPSMTGQSCWDVMMRRGIRQNWVTGGDA
jgi:hypothetical protein